MSSTRITVSAPSGNGAPVMMRVACIAPRGSVANAPAAIVSSTGSSTGALSVAPSTSTPRTA